MKMLWLNPSGHEDSEHVFEKLHHVCERNGKSKRPSNSLKVCLMKFAFT
jgi:hypothetical protein